MYVIRDGNMPIDRSEQELFKAAAMYLQKFFNKYAGKEMEDSFRWIKSEMTMPSFSDLIFAWKNKIFVVIPLATYKDSIILPHDNRVVARMISLAKENDLEPCIFPVWNTEEQYSAWNLFDAASYEKSRKLIKINPLKVANEEDRRMSEWELYDFAISVIKNNVIQEEGLKIASWHDVPDVNPQIFFFDKNNRLSWVYVRYSLNGKVKDWDSSFKELDNTIRSTPLYNGDAYYATVDVNTKDGLSPFRNRPIGISLEIIPSL